MIAPVMFCMLKSYMLSVALYLISFYPKRTGKVTKTEVQYEEVGGQAVLGRQRAMTTPWLTERHGYDPT